MKPKKPVEVKLQKLIEAKETKSQEKQREREREWGEGERERKARKER